MRHPTVERYEKPKPAAKSEPMLMTSFNMDFTGEAPVIPAFLMASAKKRRGRQKKGANKTENSEGKDGFQIPEGFLEILNNKQAEGAAEKKPARKPRGRKLKVDTPSLENSESESAPIKRSRRIQVLQEKKMSEMAVEIEREQRMLEQFAKKSGKGTPQKSPLKAKETKSPRSKPKFQPPTPDESLSNTGMDSARGRRKTNSRARNLTKMHLMYEDESKDSNYSTSRETEKSKRRRRRGGANGKRGYKPWDVSSGSESSVQELTEEEEEEREEEEPLVFEVNDDEFACEEEDEDYVPVVVRRARTAKKIIEDMNVEATVVNDDKPCSKCGKYDKPEWILLCDKCDSGYHTHCLIPPLMLIPEGDWYCQPCEHAFLCEWIQKELHELEIVLKQREREQLRKQRLAYVGISLDNVLKPEKKEESDAESSEDQENEEKEEEEESDEDAPRKSKKHRKKDRDQESSTSEDEKLKKLYGKRSVRARRTVNYQFKEYDELIASAIGDEVDVKLPEEIAPKEPDDDEENDSDRAFQAKFPKQKKRKTTRLNDLDYSDDEDSGEEFRGSDVSDSEKSVAPSVSASDAGSGLSEEWKVVKKSRGKKKKKKSKKKSRRGRKDDSEEDWDDEELSDEDYKPVTRRSAAKKAVSYREISSEDEWDPKPKAKKRKKSTTSYSEEDSEASFKQTKKKSSKIVAKAPKSKKKRVRKWASSDSSEESERSEVFEESSGSDNKWKVKKTKVSKAKTSINKKVLSSEEDEEEEVPKKKKKKDKKDKKKKKKKKKAKIVSEEEESEEEEESVEEEFEDEEEEEDVRPPKVVVQVPGLPAGPKVVVKLPPQPGAPPQPAMIVRKDVVPPAEPMTEKVVVSMVQDKASPIVRVMKKDTTKMVPCLIPYDKSPKSGPEVAPEMLHKEGIIQTAPQPVPYVQTLPPQQYLPRTPMPVPRHPVGVITRAPAPVIQTVPVPERRPPYPTGQIVQPFSNEDDSDDEVPLERIPTAMPNPMPNKAMGYTPAKELPGFTYTAPEEKGYQPSYTNLGPYQDYSNRPPPLRPSIVDNYNRASPSRLTPLDSYPPAGSGKGPYPMRPSMADGYNRASPSKLTPLEPRPHGPYPVRPSMMETYNRASPSKLTPLEPVPQGPYPVRPSRIETYNRSSPSNLTPLEPAPQGAYPVKPSMMETYNRSSPSKLTPLEPSPQGPYPLKPSMMETYNRASPSKLTPLEPYSQSNSPKLLSLDSYSKKKQHFYGNPGGDHHPEMSHRPPPPPDSYQRDIGFPPEPTQFPPSPGAYHRSTPPHPQRDPGTPPRFHSQYPEGYAPPRSPEYYQNSPYYQGDDRSRPGGYQPNYPPPEHGGPYPPNPYVATPVPQPNGGFMIDTLLRNPEGGEDELTGVTDIVSYITQGE